MTNNQALAEAAGEVTEHVVETTLDVVEAVPTVIKNNPLVLAGVAVASAAVGAGVALYFGNKHFEKKFAEISEKEIAEAKVFYNQKYKTGEYADPTTLAAQYDDEPDEDDSEELKQESNAVAESIRIIEDQKYTPYNKASAKAEPDEREVVEVTTSIKKSIFGEHPADELGKPFDEVAELAKKEAGTPYIIKEVEFLENPFDRSETTLTYYEADNILADERDVPVTNIVGVIGGEENLRFGYGTEDRNCVYITNEKLDANYNVVRETGSFAEIVHGIQHSDRPRIRRMRAED